MSDLIFKWQPLDDSTEWARVPEGWVLHTFTKFISGGKEITASEALITIIDPKHEMERAK